MLRSFCFAVAILVSVPAVAWAGATTCLTGTDPEVTGDDAEIRDARATIDAACPCATYDGTDGFGRGDYLGCVKTAMAGITTLRKPCGGTVKKIYKGSSCGRATILGARPCIYEPIGTGKLGCKIRYTNKKDGTPNDKCVSNTKYTATACDDHDFCLDAADTNDDLLIAAPGDDGQCVVATAPEGETICQELASAACSAGGPGTSGTVLVGDVLTPGMIYRGGQVVIDDTGVIVHVGCASTCTGPCATLSSTATTVTCPDGAISPGLINSHDHITFSHNDPFNDTGERYEHRHDWRLGLNGHNEIDAPGGATADQVRYAELRGLIAGTTSTVGSGGQAGLQRNLDSILQEGLSEEPVEADNFPLGDSGGTQLASGCAYGGSMVETSDIDGFDAYHAHVGEGIDAFGRNEMTCLSLAPNDIVAPQTAITGGLALTVAQMMENSSRGTALIWSPRSNIALYGNTAEPQVMRTFGMTIALGTDWMPTGSMNMLRELRCAASFDDDYLGDSFTDQELWLMATRNAADVASFAGIGTLEAGAAADIAIFDQSAGDGYAAVVHADPQDVLLVMRGGNTLYGQAPLAADLNGGSCDTTTVCDEMRNVCLQEIAHTLGSLQGSVGGVYPLFACGDPVDEPSCIPSRSVSVSGSSVYDGIPTGLDADADGVADAGDNCPGVFNPIRPVDGGAQADDDGDDVGNACDPCPADADTTDCTFDPDDLDSDGVANAMDNCPYDSNVSQADSDADLHGDACDGCPMNANPGDAPCPELVAFGPTGMYVREGDTAEPTFAEQLTVEMGEVVSGDTFVAIDSSDPGSLTVAGGGVTVLDGQSTAVVLLNGIAQSPDVTLTATFGSTVLDAHVRVLGIAEQPVLTNLSPAVTTVVSGGTRTLTVTVDIPAPPGGTVVSLALDPPGAGTIPATVTVLSNETQADFDYVDGSVVTEMIVQATLGFDSFVSEIAVVSPGGAGLVINEVDYDQIGTDSAEFFEIYNPTAGNVSLENVSAFLINGSDSMEYAEFDLTEAGFLEPGGYVIVGSSTVVPPMGVQRVDMASGVFQNGPDGVLLEYTTTATVLDSMTYEGVIAGVTEGGSGTVADSNVANGSVSRLPNGSDTNDNAADFGLTSTSTPGAANVP
jgi:hypothetical protein